MKARNECPQPGPLDLVASGVKAANIYGHRGAAKVRSVGTKGLRCAYLSRLS